MSSQGPIEIPTISQLDKKQIQKMIFITNALEKGWTVKNQTIPIYLPKNMKIKERYFKRII